MDDTVGQDFEQDVATRREIARILAIYWTPEDAALWMKSPQPQLDGWTAERAFAAGRSDDVLAILKRLDDAVYL